MSRSTTRLHHIWQGMKDRCYNPNCKDFKNYGSRGIIVCEEWLHNYPAFEEWAYANGYREYLSIDRKDNDKGYSPDNCRWATDIQQANNKRNPAKKHMVEGEALTVKEWSERFNINYRTMQQRLRLQELTLEKLSSPVSERAKHFVEINGEVKPLRTWARIHGISWTGIRRRYAKGLRGVDLIAPTPKQKERANASPAKVER